MARKRTVVGIDIGHFAVKAVWARMGEKGFAAFRAESLRLPSGEANAASFIRTWIQKIGLAGSECVIGVSGRDIIFQPLQLIPADPRSFEQTAAVEIIKFNEMASDTMLYSFSPFVLQAGDRRILLSIVRPAIMQNVSSFARELNLTVVDIIPSPVALFNIMDLQHGDENTPSIYLDVGHTATSMAIGLKSNLIFARAFACGGQMFTNALVEQTERSFNQAESLKTTAASLSADNQYSPMLLKVAGTWISEFDSCMSIYRNLFPDPKATPSKIILTGGASQLRGFAEFIASRTKLPVTVVSSITGMAAQPADAASCATAAGLAISGLQADTNRISLLPGRMKSKLFFRRQKPFWLASAAAALLILGISLSVGYFDLVRMQAKLATQVADLTERQELGSQIETVRARNEKTQLMAEPVAKMIASAPLMAEVMSVAAKAKDENDWITLIADTNSYFNAKDYAMSRRLQGKSRGPELATAKEEEFPPGMASVIIEGYTRSPTLATIKKLIAELEKSDYVQSADLLSDDRLVTSPDQENKPETAQGIHFVIEVKTGDRKQP